MPRQNRVTPAGELVAVPDRGTLMGNRGVLHAAAGRIVRGWQLRRWIVCVLAFKGRHREVMSPGRYTELFFLDEATALAAGHRPCAECRRERFDTFRAAVAGPGSPHPSAIEIDERLHADRLTPGGAKRLFDADPAELPDGVMVRIPGRAGTAYLLWQGRLREWSPGGYTARHPVGEQRAVAVLTPASTVAAIRAGYRPAVHPSAEVRA